MTFDIVMHTFVMLKGNLIDNMFITTYCIMIMDSLIDNNVHLMSYCACEIHVVIVN